MGAPLDDHHVKCPLESRKEWTHLNSIELTPDRLAAQLPADEHRRRRRHDGDVRWRWGADVSHQHNATLVDDDHILVFDNGCHRREAPSFSKIVEVDRATREIVELPERADPRVLQLHGQRMRAPANGNTFVTEGATGRLFEITPDGETVWEYMNPWVFPSPFGLTPAVFRAHRVLDDDPRLVGLALSPAPYEALNTRIAADEILGEADEPQ